MSNMAPLGSSKKFFVIHESEDEDCEQEKPDEGEESIPITDVDRNLIGNHIIGWCMPRSLQQIVFSWKRRNREGI